MLEWLAVTTGAELGKLALEQVLDLSKPVLEGYAQDFFKDYLSNGVSRLNAPTLKTPMAVAVGYFIKRFVRELQLIIDDIIRFSQQYPKAQVLVTSRIIGYNPDRFQHSGFRHFTIQS
ncbi:MAG TPA: hypothetical protein V6C88_06840, partial [Chroococcidiopsis sp.]